MTKSTKARSAERSAASSPTFTKSQFLSSTRYTAAQRDVLAAMLEDDQTYSDAEAQQKLRAYMNRSVN